CRFSKVGGPRQGTEQMNSAPESNSFQAFFALDCIKIIGIQFQCMVYGGESFLAVSKDTQRPGFAIPGGYKVWCEFKCVFKRSEGLFVFGYHSQIGASGVPDFYI